MYVLSTVVGKDGGPCVFNQSQRFICGDEPLLQATRLQLVEPNLKLQMNASAADVKQYSAYN